MENGAGFNSFDFYFIKNQYIRKNQLKNYHDFSTIGRKIDRFENDSIGRLLN